MEGSDVEGKAVFLPQGAAERLFSFRLGLTVLDERRGEGMRIGDRIVGWVGPFFGRLCVGEMEERRGLDEIGELDDREGEKGRF